MNLKSGSTCSWLVLSPDDCHYMVDGTWTFNEETNELKLYNTEGKEDSKFVIEEVKDNLLKTKK